MCKEGDQREKEIEKLLSLQQNCQKLTFTELWLICVDEEEAPSPRRLREGVQKIDFFLGNSPKQQTPPTHPYGLGLT